MNALPARSPRIVQLADEISTDIRRRRLKPGDPYLTTAETARLLGTSTMAANRALQLLVQRQVLRRRQKAGTIVAEPAEANRGNPLKRVHLLVHRHYLETERLLADGRVIGIQSELPGADIQFSFPPEGGELAHIQEMVRSALANHEPEGFVVSRASLEVQRFLAGCGLPVVLAGTTFPSVRGLACIDRDHTRIGRLLAEHLLKRGARWIAAFNRERMLAGDHQTYDAIRDAVAAAGLPANSLTLRCLPYDREAVATEVRSLLQANTSRGGIICRGLPLVERTAEALADIRVKATQAPMLAVCDVFIPTALPYASTQPTLGPEAWGAMIGRMLAQQALGEVLEPNHQIIPVKLELPSL